MSWLKLLVLFKLVIISKKKYFFIKTNKKTNLLLQKLIQCNLISSSELILKNLVKIYPNQKLFLFKSTNFKILYKTSKKWKINIKTLSRLKNFKNSNFFLLSTNCGILTNQEALQKKIGGVIICKFF